MAEDYRDKIHEIRARRRGNDYIGAQPHQSQSQLGGAGYDPSPGIGAAGSGGSGGAGAAGQRGNVSQSLGVNVGQQVQSTQDLFGPDFKSPWLRDRVTLSLEGQIAMMEGRNTRGANNVDLGYTNRIPIQPIRSGIFVKIEPPGTYRLSYHYR